MSSNPIKNRSAGQGRSGNRRAAPARPQSHDILQQISDLREVVARQTGAISALTDRLETSTSRQKDLQAALDHIQELVPALEKDVREGISELEDALAARELLPGKSATNRVMLRRIKQVVRDHVPRNSVIVVVGKPDKDLLNIRGQQNWCYPQNLQGQYAGYYPAGDTAAIVQLEVLRSRGAQYFLIPETSRWWLSHYRGFRRHLEHRYRLVTDQPDSCVLYSLREASSSRNFWAVMDEVLAEFQKRYARSPAILDLNSGLNLAKEMPHEAVFSPPSAGLPLPYLDESMDIVVLGGETTLRTEADRVAGVAVIIVSGNHTSETAGGRVQVRFRTSSTGDEPPTTSIIIPCFNAIEHTEACLTALRETLPHNFRGEIIIVDDASTDDTPTRLKDWTRRDKRLRVIRNAKNAGFVASSNKGARAAKGEFLVFLNNDTIPLPGWLTALWRVFRDFPDAGAVGGKLVFPDGTLQEAGGIIFRDGSAAHFGRGDSNVDQPLYSYIREVDYCSGALLATKRALFDEVGRFDTHFKPAYYEDTNYCFALRDKGYRVYYQPESVVIHIEGATAGTDLSVGTKRYQVVNHAKFTARWQKALQRQSLRPASLDFAAFHALANRRQARGVETKCALVCALLPEVDRDSGSRRILHIAESLIEDGWTLTFVSHHENPGERYVKRLQQRGIAVYSGDAKWIEKLAATQAYGLAIFGLWDIAEPYIGVFRGLSPETRIVVESIDLHFLRNARRAFRETGEKRASGSLDSGYASAMIRELNTYAAADGVLTVSQKEADLINDVTGEPDLAYAVPDGEESIPAAVPLIDRRGIVFVGCYRHTPNARAVEYLCKDILPLMSPGTLEKHPVYIVGDGLDETIIGYGKDCPQVRMVGWVPSVIPYLQRARLSVAPLLYGAGTKRKLLQSLLCGTPAVSTRIGTEGLDLHDGEHVLVADDAASFARAIERLIQDDDLWLQIERAGRARMQESHVREAVRTSMAEVMPAILQKEPKFANSASKAAVAQAAFSRDEYQLMIARIQDTVSRTLTADATVVVVSKGDEALLQLGAARCWHFPQAEDGRYKGYYPKHSDEAIAEVERLRNKGANHLLFPSTALWWFEHYAEFKQHLDRNYRLVLNDEATCLLYSLRENTAHDIADSPNARLIAFFLPQFHPIPENDAWWGKGFTEWSNVAGAKPLFEDHYQPRLPADLGFYDLRLLDIQRSQAALARNYGIHGFCYYHYWFNGKQLLERPFRNVLDSRDLDFPFCLCWANEPWSRRWDGRPKDVLQPQTYSEQDDLAHIQWLVPALADARAIQIDGKPVFIVYQAKELPAPARTVDVWREQVHKAGLKGIYLIACETGWDAGWDATQVGFDAKVAFQPQFATLFNSGARLELAVKESLRVFDYNKAWPVLANPEPVSYRRFDTVCPSWDNSARRGENAVVLHNSTPEAYEAWLRLAISKTKSLPEDHRIVFINAWNEWGEGCYLEPDRRHGHAYLEATRRAALSARPNLARKVHA